MSDELELDDNALLSDKAKLTISVALWVPILLYWGFTISLLWGWFVEPMIGFNIQILHAAGLRLVFKAFTGPDFKFEDVVSDDDWIVANFTTAVTPLCLMGMGWLFQHYMGA